MSSETDTCNCVTYSTCVAAQAHGPPSPTFLSHRLRPLKAAPWPHFSPPVPRRPFLPTLPFALPIFARRCIWGWPRCRGKRPSFFHT